MNELQTITQATKTLGVSTRMLRHYERIGLVESKRVEGYAYRVYDEEALTRLKQIVILRKLRVSLGQIAVLLRDDNTVNAIDLFMQNISEMDEEIASLRTIRNILQALVDKLRENAGLQLSAGLLSDKKLMVLVAPLSINQMNLKEAKTMSELNRASERLGRLTDKDVRIIYLPPATVAASHFIGDEPEQQAAVLLNQFVQESKLREIKPDTRSFGFNHPDPRDETNFHGYEIWATIPDNMEVPPPLEKKRFEGGLYAAYMIPIGMFEAWHWLWKWAENSEKYDLNLLDDDGECSHGILEEALLFGHPAKPKDHGSSDDLLQLDLLLPIKEKK